MSLIGRASKDVAGVAPGPLRIEVKASILANKLRNFAAFPTADKEERLTAIVAEMPNLVSRQVLESAVYDSENRSLKAEFNRSLETAALKALATPVITKDGIVDRWMDDRYVLIALGRDGEILGFDGAKEGEKTFSYAVTKALCTMVLNDWKHKSPGDMLDCSNISYLEGLGLKLGESLFIGGIKPVTITFSGKLQQMVHFAAGGIDPNAGYVKGLIKEEPKSSDTLAGAAEMMFGEMVIDYLTNPEKAIQPYKEPDYLEFLRMTNPENATQSYKGTDYQHFLRILN